MSVENKSPVGKMLSPLHRWHQNNRADYLQTSNTWIVSSYQDNSDEQKAASNLGLCDLSLLGRTGFKGKGSVNWLTNILDMPSQPNTARQQHNGALVARLSSEEFLIIDAINSDSSTTESIDRRFGRDRPNRVYALPRQHSHSLFALSGKYASETMAKLCAIDLSSRHFEPGAVAQTSVARSNAIVIRCHTSSTPVYFLLSDITAGEYMWSCLLDAMQEHDGFAVGLPALQTLFRSPIR